jgi:hypothetical protein
MARKFLLGILTIALLIELGLTGGIFFAKDIVAEQFHVAITADTSFLVYIVGWLCLFASMFILLALRWVMQGDVHYVPLCYIMGFFWIAIGIAIYVSFGKPDNLFIDTLKGILIVSFTYWTQMHSQKAALDKK